MATRRFNYTGRKRILAKHVEIRIDGSGSGARLSANLNLAEYELPNDAQVRIEAYSGSLVMRFAYGTVGSPKPPRGTNPPMLSEFTNHAGLLFRVKVTRPGPDALLLAEADRLKAEGDLLPDEGILPVKLDDLGQTIWRIDIDSVDGPTLTVNSQLPAAGALATDPLFQSLVYPAIFRQVLGAAIKTGSQDDGWERKWIELADSIGAPVHPADGNETEEWLDETCSIFAEEHKLLTTYNGLTHPGEEDE